MTQPAAIEISGLSIRAGGRLLLEDASLNARAGEVVLLVGLSGSGKSVTLRLLAGLLDDDIAGLEVGGTALLFGEPSTIAARRRAGVVFQDFGLFDELSTEENVRFAHDHRRATEVPNDPATNPEALLAELDLPRTTRVAALSGGMKQRCAIARTLAFDPDIIFYDEPTSGLDPAMAQQVAARIRRTNDEHGKTAFIVTHDLETLAGIADRIWLLDPMSRGFREVGADDVAWALAELRRFAPPIDEGAPPRATASKRATAALREFLVATSRAVEATLKTVAALAPLWPRARWGLRYLGYYLRLTAIGTALPYVAVCGFILGLIVTWFTFSFLPFKQFTEPLLIDKVIGAIGYGLYRIMVPGMVAMLIAARSGAALAADVGHRVVSRQTDALRSFGVRPERLLFTNILWASLLGAPLLIAVNFIAARAASLVVFLVVHPEQSTWFWHAQFDRFLDAGGRLYEGTGWLISKSLLSAAGVAAIAWFQGRRPKGSGRDVAVAVTRTIIWATLFVLLVQLGFALAEFEPI